MDLLTRGGEEANDSAVGVADEMVSGIEALRDPRRMLLEVDAGCGVRRLEARPLEDDEIHGAGDLAPLLAPGGAAADDASVDEDDSLHCCH